MDSPLSEEEFYWMSGRKNSPAKRNSKVRLYLQRYFYAVESEELPRFE